MSNREPKPESIRTSLKNTDHESRMNRREAVFNAAFGGVALVALGVGLKDLKDMALRGETFTGEINPAIHGIELYEGARFRSSPTATPLIFDNLLTTLSNSDDGSQSVTIQTPEGIFESFSTAGSWYGIRAEDLATAYFTGKISINLSDTLRDGDNILWVNEQRATPVESLEEIE